MNPPSFLLKNAELLLAPERQLLTESDLDAVTVQPGINVDARESNTRKILQSLLPSAELELMLTENGTQLNDSTLEGVTAQPGVDKDTLMSTIRTRAMETLKKLKK